MENHNQIIFAIYDADFGIRSVFNTESTTDGIRAFASMCQNEKNIQTYADKFQLWKLGVVNGAGEIKNEVVVLENATTYVPEKQKSQEEKK